MFGPKLRTVFASRWKAVWFAASILLTAYCSIPAPDAQQASPAQAPGPAQKAQGASNPWALKPGEKVSHIIR